MFKGGRIVIPQNFENKRKGIFAIYSKIGANKNFLFKPHVHLILSEGVFELCEVTLNPKQQTLVQRQTKKWKGKIKIEINKMACIGHYAFKLFSISMSEMLLWPC